MPALFLGHGNPMNAVQDNTWTRAWRSLGETLPQPRAILAVSAHWYAPGIAVTAMAAPRTIHDFGGFPRPLYEVRYPAPGDPALAQRVRELLGPLPVRLDDAWGLDHGTWSVLVHLVPDASIPVVQLSLDETRAPAFHFDLGRRLAPLRDEGILILGSGNLVHNLHAYGWGRHVPEPYDWAVRFETEARRLMVEGDVAPLVDYERLGPDALLSVPTPEHFLPLLHVLGARREEDTVDFPVEGIDGGSVSMLAVRVSRYTAARET
jgi:4,5-DOPA dioxygenase extradiol